jgi:hypothetical protein
MASMPKLSIVPETKLKNANKVAQTSSAKQTILFRPVTHNAVALQDLSMGEQRIF